MIIKINAVSSNDLLKIDVAAISAVSLEGYLDSEKLDILLQLLNRNRQINLVVVADPGLTEKKGMFTGLQILSQLPSLRNLKLLNFGSEPLENLEPMRSLTNLELFQLSGNYNKKISLDPLLEAKDLKVLELEFGLADKKQCKVINQLTKLAQLKLSALDAAEMTVNENLTHLSITNTLKSPDLVPRTFPNLSSFSISYAKGLESFDFLSPLKKLTQLSISYTQKLIGLPKLSDPANIRTLSLLNTPHFNGIEQLQDLENLESLTINEFDRIPITKVPELGKLKNLKTLVLNFKNDADQEQFEKLALKNKWRTNSLQK